MAKPKKYPKKLRMKLEKLHDAHERDDKPPYETLITQLLATQKVETMHVRLDEAVMTMETVYRLHRANPAALRAGSPITETMFDRRPLAFSRGWSALPELRDLTSKPDGRKAQILLQDPRSARAVAKIDRNNLGL